MSSPALATSPGTRQFRLVNARCTHNQSLPSLPTDKLRVAAACWPPRPDRSSSAGGACRNQLGRFRVSRRTMWARSTMACRTPPRASCRSTPGELASPCVPSPSLAPPARSLSLSLAALCSLPRHLCPRARSAVPVPRCNGARCHLLKVSLPFSFSKHSLCSQPWAHQHPQPGWAGRLAGVNRGAQT